MNKDTIVTDTAGKATASMIFGKKSGQVVVNAYSTDDTTAGTTFDLTAVPGSAAKINNSIVGGVAKDTVMKVKQFTINLYDSELNGRKGDTVLISWADSAKSKKDSLFTNFVVIDTFGNATTPVLARLGEKVGNYTLKATAKNNPLLSSSINLTATNDVPAKMVSFPTIFTDTIGAVVHQLATILRDRYDNSVPFTPVTYTVIGRPDTTAGGKVDSAVVHTDSIGKATNTFTIGTKVGTYQVNALANGIQSIFSITAKPGVPQKFIRCARSLSDERNLESALTLCREVDGPCEQPDSE